MKNTTTTNATTCTALTIITRAALHESRAAAARARHDLTTAAVIILPDHMHDLTEADHAAHLYRVAHSAVAVCLRARSQSEGGEGFTSDLRRMWAGDALTWEKAAAMSDTEQQHRAEHDRLRARADINSTHANRLEREAAKLTTDPALLEHLLSVAQLLRKEAARDRDAAAEELETAEAIARRIETVSASDREALVHEAIAGYLAHGAGGHESDAFRAACTAAGKAVDALRAAHADGVTTKLQRMGGEGSSEADNLRAYEAWQQQHPNADKVPFSVRGGMTSGYWTAEHREASKPRKDGSSRRPAGYYLVAHYRRPAPAPLSEAMDMAAPQPVALLDVQSLISAANLTQRQRAALLLLCIATGTAKPRSSDPAKLERILKAARIVTRAGLEAVKQHDTETAAAVEACDTQRKRQRKQRERDKQREGIRSRAMMDKALQLAGVPAEQVAKQRAALRSKLEQAMQHKPAAITSTAAPKAAQPVTITRQDATGRDLYTLTPDPAAVKTWPPVIRWTPAPDMAAAVIVPDTSRAYEEAAAAERNAARAAAVAALIASRPEYPAGAGALSARMQAYEAAHEAWKKQLQTL